MSTPFVAILMGSDSDFPVMQTTLDVLKSFGISYEVKVTSAHLWFAFPQLNVRVSS